MMSIKEWLSGFSNEDRKKIMSVVDRVDNLEKQNMLLQTKLLMVAGGLKETQALVPTLYVGTPF